MSDWICSECGTPVEESPPEVRPPCLACGATARTTFASVTAPANSQVYLKTRALYRDGGRKVVRELIEGDDYYQKTGRWSFIYRLIDRGNNWYKEIFRDSETGEIIHQKDMPLTEHKTKPKPKKI
jgi:hypothetical protein